jgi:hypothetical protein
MLPLCIMCMREEADPWNGGICDTCLPPLKPYKARRRAPFKITAVYTITLDELPDPP